MRYSIEPRDRIYVKRYGFLSFAKNMGKNLRINIVKKLLIQQKNLQTDAIKTDSKIAIQKPAEATGNLIGNKIADKTTSVSRKTQNNESEADTSSPKNIPKKDTYLRKKGNKLLIN